ncbi:hypothetical protein [Streptantibioticus ferralitis]|uniref:VIT family protein n=1 Tax=Streptantibioticus ferralitis TaxID=236510 RepID=A0ABT5YU74_9ACTN|nr:hypothetical protein [Streptantibioticus ferralitis]MDF2255154.1 hypothetical protein [Streptantibioticus ferralitis]
MRIRSRFESLGRWVLPLDNPVEGILGTVITAALLAAYSEPPFHVGAIAFGTLVAVLVYWLTHVYAEEIGRGPETGPAFSKHRLKATLRRQYALVEASFPPLAVLLAAFAFGATPSLALDFAEWSAVLLLVVWGFVTARRHELKGVAFVAAGLIAGVLGLVIVVLRSTFH